MKGDKGSSAGARHGSNAHDTTDRDPTSASGLNERTGEFNVGEKIIFGMRNGNILFATRPRAMKSKSPKARLAGLMIDAFFSDGKLGDKYQPVQEHDRLHPNRAAGDRHDFACHHPASPVKRPFADGRARTEIRQSGHR
jgi:hypothetical protein